MKNILHYPHGDDSSLWDKIEQDLAGDEVLDYGIVITEGGRKVALNIDVDLGGGFEGGYASTSMSSMIAHSTAFRFAIHREDFIDEIGKFFGMQDVRTGFDDFDKKMIVKTNDESLVKLIFSDPEVRETFLSLGTFSFGIHTHHVSGSKEPFLELLIDDAITDVSRLKKLYTAFSNVLQILDEQMANNQSIEF